MSALHRARLSFEGAAGEVLAIRLACQHAAQATRRREGEALDTWGARVRQAQHTAACEQIHRTVWPEPRVGNIGSEYPDAKRDTLDTWARAGLAHGVLDVLTGAGPRCLDVAVPEQKQAVYYSAYMLGRALMTGVSA